MTRKTSWQSVTYRYREFPVPGIFIFFGGIGTGIGKIWYRKKVPVSVSEKFGTGKKYQYRYRKNLVPEKSTSIGIGKIWYRKKYRNWYRKKIDIKKGFVFLSNLVILIFHHRIFFLNPITKCKFLFIIMKFFSKAKLDDDIYSMPNK